MSRIFANESGLCLSSAAPPPPPPGPCLGDLDCSLNGECVSGKCVCRSAWKGQQCELLVLQPVSFPQGYGMQPNLTSWGGNILPGSDGRYHLYVSAMANHCPLNKWGSNSRIDHAVAPNATGPFVFQDVAVDVWSHNSAPIALADGTYAIVHIGSGEGGHPANCTTQAASAEAYGGPRMGLGLELGPVLGVSGLGLRRRAVDGWVGSTQVAGIGSTIHVSASLDGPWKPLVPNTLPSCNNPAPWVMPNGTIFILCGNTLLRSDRIQGPWRTVTDVNVDHSHGYVDGNYEDPFVYTDAGGFHILWHVYNTHEDKYECVNSTVSAHFYSKDGFKWFTHGTQPYTTQVQLASGSIVTVSTRERPKILFDRNGAMTHLVNGVCSAIACPPPTGPSTGCVDCKYNNWDYTLVQPIG